MNVDFLTLTAAGGFVALVSGLLLVAAGTRYRRSETAYQLGASHLFAATAILLLPFGGYYPHFTLAAQPIFALAAVLALHSVMSFLRTSRSFAFLLGAAVCAFAGFLLIVFALLLTFGWPSGAIRTVQLVVTSPMFLACAWVLWRGRGEELRARKPLAGLFLMHGLTNSVGLLEAVLWQALESGVPSFSDWYGLIHFESVVYFVGTAIFTVAMIKERSEARHRAASLTDPLTGLANRRAFFTACDRILQRGQSGGPVTVLAIDLDRFKSINDTFGHALGDRVLQVFADVAREQLRQSDLAGRLGGEEFAVLLPRTHSKEATELADRLRTSFAASAEAVDGRQVHGTLSIGVATVFSNEATIAEVLERADGALYRAKLNGRNRVEVDTVGQSIRLIKASGL